MFTSLKNFIKSLPVLLVLIACSDENYHRLDKDVLKDKIRGAWAAQTVGVTYGGPTEFRYNKNYIPDSVEIIWTDTTLQYWMENIPGLYDDIYMDLTFVDVMEKEGIDAELVHETLVGAIAPAHAELDSL